MPYQGLIQRPRGSGRGWHSGRGPANIVNAWRPKLTSGSSEGRGVKTHRAAGCHQKEPSQGPHHLATRPPRGDGLLVLGLPKAGLTPGLLCFTVC